MDFKINENEVNEIEEELHTLKYDTEEGYQGVIKQFYKDIANIPLMSSEDEKEITTRMFNGDESAKQEVITRNLRLAAHIARKYSRSNEDMEDLLQEACIGLMRATDTYNPNTGYRFSTYAYWWIKQGINRYIDNNASTIRIPVHAKEKMRKFTRWKSDYMLKFGLEPSVEEVKVECSKIGLSYKNYLEYSNVYNCVSLNQLAYTEDDSETELGDFVSGEESVEKDIDNLVTNEVLNTIMDAVLTDTEKWVLEHRFYAEMTLEECGREMGVTRERIRQIEGKAIRKMLHSRKSRGLRDLVGYYK